MLAARMNTGFPESRKLFILSNRIIHPDFTVLNVRTREILYWEHLGMMDNKPELFMRVNYE